MGRRKQIGVGRALLRHLMFEACEQRLLLTVGFRVREVLQFPEEVVVVNVRAVDLDVDSNVDLAIVTTESQIKWYRNSNDGGFDFANQILQSSSEVYFGQGDTLEFGDIDKDGDLDLLSNLGGISWYENVDGMGTFEHAYLIRDLRGFAPLLADLDNDSDLDVATWEWTGREYGGVFWYENVDRLQPGVFGPELSLEGSWGSTFGIGMSVADFNSDGRQDFLANASGAGGPCAYLAWFAGQDNQANPFGPRTPLGDVNTECSFYADPMVADFDGDGDVDVLGVTSKAFWWHENVGGAEVFAPRQELLQQAAEVMAIIPVDVDNDGDTDVVYRSVETAPDGRQTDRIDWLENDGNGVIVGNHRISDLSFFNIGDIVDIDSDGDLDIVGSVRNQVLVLESDLAQTEPTLLGKADIDRNGAVDFADFLILSANFGRSDAVATEGDLNEDATVDFSDFLLLSSVFGSKLFNG